MEARSINPAILRPLRSVCNSFTGISLFTFWQVKHLNVGAEGEGQLLSPGSEEQARQQGMGLPEHWAPWAGRSQLHPSCLSDRSRTVPNCLEAVWPQQQPSHPRFPVGSRLYACHTIISSTIQEARRASLSLRTRLHRSTPLLRLLQGLLPAPAPGLPDKLVPSISPCGPDLKAAIHTLLCNHKYCTAI